MLTSTFEKMTDIAGVVIRKSCGLLLIFAATCGTAQALPVPEIDPGSATVAIAMLASGFFLFTGSRRRA